MSNNNRRIPVGLPQGGYRVISRSPDCESEVSPFPTNNVPFQEEWRDNLGGIANAINWMGENFLDASITYFGMFPHHKDGHMIGWHFTRNEGLKYTITEATGSNRTPVHFQNVVVTPLMMKVCDSESQKHYDVYRPYVDPPDHSKTIWKPMVQWVRVHNNYLTEISSTDYGLRAQIYTLLVETLFDRLNYRGRRSQMVGLFSTYVAPEVSVPLDSPVRMTEVQPIWVEYARAIVEYKEEQSDEDRDQKLRAIGDAIFKLNGYLGSMYTTRESIEPLLSVDVENWSAAHLPGQVAHALETLFGL